MALRVMLHSCNGIQQLTKFHNGRDSPKWSTVSNRKRTNLSKPSLATIPDGFMLKTVGCSNHNYLGITKTNCRHFKKNHK